MKTQTILKGFQKYIPSFSYESFLRSIITNHSSEILNVSEGTGNLKGHIYLCMQDMWGEDLYQVLEYFRVIKMEASSDTYGNVTLDLVPK